MPHFATHLGSTPLSSWTLCAQFPWKELPSPVDWLECVLHFSFLWFYCRHSDVISPWQFHKAISLLGDACQLPAPPPNSLTWRWRSPHVIYPALWFTVKPVSLPLLQILCSFPPLFLLRLPPTTTHPRALLLPLGFLCGRAENPPYLWFLPPIASEEIHVSSPAHSCYTDNNKNKTNNLSFFFPSLLDGFYFFISFPQLRSLVNRRKWRFGWKQKTLQDRMLVRAYQHNPLIREYSSTLLKWASTGLWFLASISSRGP